MLTLSRCVLALAFAVTLAPRAFADDRAKALADRLESAKASLVSVELTARVATERLPGLGEGARRIVRTDATGVVLTADGLVAIAASRVDPTAPAFALLGARARAEVEKVLVFGTDGKPREATFVGRDEERGLAFVRVSPAGRAGLSPVALAEGPLPGLGEELAVVSLAPRVLGRAPRVEVSRVSFVAEKPRKLLGLAPSVAGAQGGLAFRLDGPAVAGIVVGLPSGGEGREESGAILTPEVLAAQAAGYLLPAADLKAAAAKPPEIAGKAAIAKRVRTWLGIKPETVTAEVAKARKLPVDDGVRVAKVYPGTPAQKAGLVEDDVITKLDGELVSLDPGDSFRTLEDVTPGQKLKLTVVHAGGKARDLEVAVAEAPLFPEDAPRVKATGIEGTVRDLTFVDRDELALPDGASGAVVTDLDADGTGSRAGLRAKDAVLAVDGKDVPGAEGLVEALGASGERTLTVRRGAEKLTLKLRR